MATAFRTAAMMIDEIYRDTHIIAVNKPAGLLCVPGLSSPDNLFDRVKAKHPNARVVHRLDMATSGLVLFALGYEAQKALSGLFERRRIEKSYQALLQGSLRCVAGEVCMPIMTDWEKRPKQKICWHSGKSALTHFRVESTEVRSEITRVKLYPITGRTHQLRIHMQALGYPILGDALYLHEQSEKEFGRLMLHAERLVFEHPLSGDMLDLRAPCPF